MMMFCFNFRKCMLTTGVPTTGVSERLTKHALNVSGSSIIGRLPSKSERLAEKEKPSPRKKMMRVMSSPTKHLYPEAEVPFVGTYIGDPVILASVSGS